MRSVQVGVAAIAVAWAMAAAGHASAAATCSATCSATFNQCTAAGGAQSSCMGAWMQCRNVCNGVSAKPVAKAPAAVTKATPAKVATTKTSAPR